MDPGGNRVGKKHNRGGKKGKKGPGGEKDIWDHPNRVANGNKNTGEGGGEAVQRNQAFGHRWGKRKVRREGKKKKKSEKEKDRHHNQDRSPSKD